MLKKIDVLRGLRYSPEMFLKRMKKSRKLDGITVRYVNTLYSLCWVFQFRVALKATRKTTRYEGYYAGFDDTKICAELSEEDYAKQRENLLFLQV